MDAPARNGSILHDLALLYIALAHSTDRHLDGAEMDRIARCLQEAQAGLSEGTVLHAMRTALVDYTGTDAVVRLRQAVANLRANVPRSLRRRIVRDLTEIGKSDDRFLYEEAHFIGELVRAWRSAPSDDPNPPDATWNVFEQEATGDWSLVHDLALIYVTLAHRTDGVLARAEIEAILQKISEWMPNARADDLRAVLNAVLQTYEARPPGRLFEDAVRAVGRQVPVHQRSAVLEDLRYVAHADGVLLVEERVLIEQLARAWETFSD